MKLVLLLLLCGGVVHFTFASNRLRFFSISNDQKNVSDSRTECKQKNASLVTLYDEEDANFTATFLIERKFFSNVWLGLHRSQNTTWSNGDPVIFSDFTVNVTNGQQKCIAIVNNKWTAFDCWDKKPFMCYRDNNYTLIENEDMTWCQALQYCRNHFSNLASISNQRQNQTVTEKGKNKTFWIGLMYDEWKWEDNGCSSFRKWNNKVENNSSCTTYAIYSSLFPLLGIECINHGDPFCSKGSARIKVIQLNLTWEEAFDYCKANHTRMLWIQDDKDQAAVEQWLNTTDAVGPFWIGLRQSRVFGFWIWSDRPVTYNNWRNGHAPEMPLSYHCGVIGTGDYKWRDENCWSQLHFLCEEEIIYM